MFDALILDANMRQALVTMRSLSAKGLSIAAAETIAGVPAFASRSCQRAFVFPSTIATDAYLAHLDSVLRDVGTQLIIPLHDGTITLLRKHRKYIERWARIALARESALAVAINKDATLAVAKRLGIGVPRCCRITSLDDLRPAAKEVGFPAVIKPSESWAGEYGVRVVPVLVTTLDETRRIAADLLRVGATMLFQEFLPGRREAVSFMYSNGHVYARFAQWAKRTAPPLGGESVLRQSITVPADIGEQAERLIRTIDLEGYSEVEFRRDGRGRAFLMEINPRLSASVGIAVASGVDFPYLLHQWASGSPIDQVAHYRVGGWMRYLKGDLLATIEALRQRGRPGIDTPARVVLDFGLTFFMPMKYDYFDRRDLYPAARTAAKFAKDTWNAVIEGKVPKLWKKTV